VDAVQLLAGHAQGDGPVSASRDEDGIERYRANDVNRFVR
jgi:hypothetical protein